MKNFFGTKLNLALFLCMIICVSNTLMSKNENKPIKNNDVKNKLKSKNVVKKEENNKLNGHLRKHIKMNSHSKNNKDLDKRIQFEVLNRMPDASKSGMSDVTKPAMSDVSKPATSDVSKPDVDAEAKKETEKKPEPEDLWVPTEAEQKKLDDELLVTNDKDKASLGKYYYRPAEIVRKVSSAAQHLFEDKQNPMFEYVVNPGWEQPKIYRGVVGEMNTSVIVNKANRQEYMRTSSDNKSNDKLDTVNNDE